MPGHFVGGYLAWAGTVTKYILIDEQFSVPLIGPTARPRLAYQKRQ